MNATTQEESAALAPVLAIEGEFTIFRAAEIKTQLLDAIARSEHPEIDIDLGGVTEIDSAGLQLMVMAKREAVRQGRHVRFVRHSDAVVDLIDLCDLAGQFGDPVLICPKN
jgi:anti-anti-sigma factor